MPDWATISTFVEGHARSRLSLAAYAREAGVLPWRAYEWRNRWRDRQQGDAVTPDVPIQAAGEPADSGTAATAPFTKSSLFRRVVAAEPPSQTDGAADGRLPSVPLQIEVSPGCRLLVSDQHGVVLAALFVQQLQAEGG